MNTHTTYSHELDRYSCYTSYSYAGYVGALAIEFEILVFSAKLSSIALQSRHTLTDSSNAAGAAGMQGGMNMSVYHEVCVHNCLANFQLFDSLISQ